MARRPVFTPLGTRPHVREVSTEFTLHPGLSLKQEQRSVDSLHRSFLSAHPGARMLEVSGGSPLVLGAELSAFRLETRTFFYDWLYVSALAGHPELVNELEHRAAFTDIEFNPKRSINCQAHSVALFQGIAGGRRRDSLRPPDHPRSRGVYKLDRATVAPIDGSSPLARGLQDARHPHRHLRGIIPARAGFTPAESPAPGASGDHPRSRGVYNFEWTSWWSGYGSSPLARGLREDPPRRPGAPGIIPARAGFTRVKFGSVCGIMDHPRSRGVYASSLEEYSRSLGSSPLARGLPPSPSSSSVASGIIPARAGFTTWRNWMRKAAEGSSPLARGLHHHRRANHG